MKDLNLEISSNFSGVLEKGFDPIVHCTGQVQDFSKFVQRKSVVRGLTVLMDWQYVRKLGVSLSITLVSLSCNFAAQLLSMYVLLEFISK